MAILKSTIINGNLNTIGDATISGGSLTLTNQSSNTSELASFSGKSSDYNALGIIFGGTVSGTRYGIAITGGSDSRLYVNNNIYVVNDVSANSFTARSDKRLKENIIEYIPEKSILDLPIYKYDFINGQQNQVGCLAQDLQEICPEIVSEDDNGYLSIQESKIVYLLLKEVKKLKQEVEELKAGK